MTNKKEMLDAIATTADALKAVAEVAAIIIGGLFAYYKFFRGRVFYTRLKTRVSGRITIVDGQHILIVTGQIENVGTSDIKLKKEAATLRVTTYTVSKKEGIGTPIEGERASYPIFPRDESIESNELLENQRLIPINVEYVAIGLELFVFSDDTRTWYTSTLIEKPKE